MGAFEKAITRFIQLDDAELAGDEMGPRFQLYSALRAEQAALVEARRRWSPTETERILAFAQWAFGDLRGLLFGLDDGVLDRAPAPGEWPLRQVLRHMLAVEIRYAAQILYSAHRREDEPVAIPTERLPCDRLDPPDAQYADTRTAGIARFLERFEAARAQTDALVGSLPDELLARPSLWGRLEIDVRTRLHQVAAHLVEHTLQCEKTLEALSVRQSEARRIVRRIWALRGELEATGDDAAMAALDAAHAERAAAVSPG